MFAVPRTLGTSIGSPFPAKAYRSCRNAAIAGTDRDCCCQSRKVSGATRSVLPSGFCSRMTIRRDAS